MKLTPTEAGNRTGEPLRHPNAFAMVNRCATQTRSFLVAEDEGVAQIRTGAFDFIDTERQG